MKALFAVCVLVVLSARVAHAGLDPDWDSMGVYFDTAGNSNCIDQPIFSPLNAYLLLANPIAPTSGFACTVTILGVPRLILSTTLAGGGLDLDASADGYEVSSNLAYPVVDGHLLLVTWSIMTQATQPLEFFLGPLMHADPVAPPTTCGRPVVWGPGGERCCGVSSGDVRLPVAGINAGCPVAAEPHSFGAVKALYR